MSVTEKELLSLQTEELSHYWEWDNQKCSCLGKRAQAAEVAWGRGATPFWVSPAGKPETTALLNLSCKQQKQFWLLWKDENACKKKKNPNAYLSPFLSSPEKCLNATGKTKKTKRKRKLLWYPSFLPPAVSLWQVYPLGLPVIADPTALGTSLQCTISTGCPPTPIPLKPEHYRDFCSVPTPTVSPFLPHYPHTPLVQSAGKMLIKIHRGWSSLIALPYLDINQNEMPENKEVRIFNLWVKRWRNLITAR